MVVLVGVLVVGEGEKGEGWDKQDGVERYDCVAHFFTDYGLVHVFACRDDAAEHAEADLCCVWLLAICWLAITEVLLELAIEFLRFEHLRLVSQGT